MSKPDQDIGEKFTSNQELISEVIGFKTRKKRINKTQLIQMLSDAIKLGNWYLHLNAELDEDAKDYLNDLNVQIVTQRFVSGLETSTTIQITWNPKH